MKVKCITNYNDIEKKRLIKAGETFEVSEARAKVLLSARVVEVVTTPTTEVDTKAAPKKRATKKKEA